MLFKSSSNDDKYRFKLALNCTTVLLDVEEQTAGLKNCKLTNMTGPMFTFLGLLVALLMLSFPEKLLATHSQRSDTHHEEPINWDVKFVSGKESASIYDRSGSMFQKRHLKVQNLAGPKINAKVSCEDPFARFSNDDLEYGDVWEFSVIDFFSRRHYWCETLLSNGVKYEFRAYGEGAPRGNNKIVLLQTGALINGRNVTL
ncbi:unnamed protein product [Allacma fusca]|uniref:Uncharacterized protein n=1 Tax=Allacma fusca TaxID=39272 RepID=A0A8J2L7Z5_9HEXA|nr:unnamed protein product [Allacma fusca]